MAEKDLKKWTKFFHEAGIPPGPSSQYATLFCDHRMKDVLLGDLTKEILNDIGINVMGDVLSILKHAKAVYAKLEREKSSNQLVPDVEPSISTNKNVEISSSHEANKKTLAPKVLNKLKTTGDGLPSTTKTKTSTNEQNVVLTVGNAAILSKKRPVKNSITLSERFATEKAPPTKISKVSSEESKVSQSGLKKLTKTHSVQTGSSSAQGATSPSPKRKSAFERLGKESNSSPKESDTLLKKKEAIKLTTSKVPLQSSKVISLTKNGKSVFGRLGKADSSSVASENRTAALTIHTVRGHGSRIVSKDTHEQSPKTHKVLPSLKPMQAVQPVKPISPLKVGVASSVSAAKEASRKSVFSRLGSSLDP